MYSKKIIFRNLNNIILMSGKGYVMTQAFLKVYQKDNNNE